MTVARPILILIVVWSGNVTALADGLESTASLGDERLFFSASERRDADASTLPDADGSDMPAAASTRHDAAPVLAPARPEAMTPEQIDMARDDSSPPPGTAVYYNGHVRSGSGVQHLFNGLPWRRTDLGIVRVTLTSDPAGVLAEFDDGRRHHFATGQSRQVMRQVIRP